MVRLAKTEERDGGPKKGGGFQTTQSVTELNHMKVDAGGQPQQLAEEEERSVT